MWNLLASPHQFQVTWVSHSWPQEGLHCTWASDSHHCSCLSDTRARAGVGSQFAFPFPWLGSGPPHPPVGRSASRLVFENHHFYIPHFRLFCFIWIFWNLKCCPENNVFLSLCSETLRAAGLWGEIQNPSAPGRLNSQLAMQFFLNTRIFTFIKKLY